MGKYTRKEKVLGYKISSVKDLSGQRFGMIVVRTLIPKPEGRSGTWWLTDCDCGHEFVVDSKSMKSGNTISCGCSHLVKIEPGDRYGVLTAVRELGSMRRHGGLLRMWEFRCDCGHIRHYPAMFVVSGKYKACGQKGCKARKILFTSLPPGEASFRSLLRAYIRSARHKGRAWQLTEDQTRALFTGNCTYCGEAPSTVHIPKKRPDYEPEPFIYNGIDRKHNDEGYTRENSTTCCAECNFLKRHMAFEKWIAWLDRIAAFRRNSTPDTLISAAGWKR